MPDPILLAKAMVLAMAVAAVVTVLLGRYAAASGAIGLGLAALAGAGVLGLAPHVPPRDALERFLLVLIPAAALAEVATQVRVKWALRTVIAIFAAPVLLYGSIYITELSGPGSSAWSTPQASLIFLALTAALLLTWGAVTELAKREGRSTAAAMVIAVGGAGVTLLLSGYASGGLLGATISAAIGMFVIIDGRYAPSALAVAVVGLFALLVIGHLFAGLTVLSGILLFFAPLLAWFPELPWLSKKLGPKARNGLRIALTAIPVIVTLWLAQQKLAADASGPSEGSGGAGLNDYFDIGK